MGQQRIAEDTQPIAQRRRARCAAKPEHQREIPPCWPPPRPAAAGQRLQRGERERQKHRPGEIEIDVEQRRAADPGQRGPEQFGQVVVGQPHAGHPQILGREGALQGGRVADVPQEIAVERRGPGPQRVGVRRAAKDAVPKAEPGPKRCVRAFQPARGVRGRPAGQCPRTAPAAPDWPQKPGQPDRRRQPQRPESPEPGGQALHGGQQPRAVYRCIQPAPAPRGQPGRQRPTRQPQPENRRQPEPHPGREVRPAQRQNRPVPGQQQRRAGRPENPAR